MARKNRNTVETQKAGQATNKLGLYYRICSFVGRICSCGLLIASRIENHVSYRILNLIGNTYFHEIVNFFSFGTCLVMVIIRIYFLFLNRIFCLLQVISIPLLSDLKSRTNTIFIQDTYLLT